MKISIVGAGSVGSLCAEHIAHLSGITEIVLVDINEGLVQGRASDIQHSIVLGGSDLIIRASHNDYSLTAKSDICIITSGLPRKPGLTREDLVHTNATIVRSVMKNLVQYSPDAIYIIVTNPMDIMTYLAIKASGLNRKKVIGMGGILDSARFKTHIWQELSCPLQDIDAIVIGGHGDETMLPVMSNAMVGDTKISSLLSIQQSTDIVYKTMNNGKLLVNLMGTSTQYGPARAIAQLVKSILFDEDIIYPCSVMLDGEYDQSDICIGVPVLVGREGRKSIVSLPLDDIERKAFTQACNQIRSMNATLSRN